LSSPLAYGQTQKTCIDASSQLLQHGAEGKDLLFNNMTGDESWFHHFKPEMKEQSMEWHHTISPK
jgi:hypothetical protein